MSNKGLWEDESSEGECKQGYAQGHMCADPPQPRCNIYDPFMSLSSVAADLGVYEAAAAGKAIIPLA